VRGLRRIQSIHKNLSSGPAFEAGYPSA